MDELEIQKLLTVDCPRLRARLTERGCEANQLRGLYAYEDFFEKGWAVLDYNFDPADVAVMVACGDCPRNKNNRVPVQEVMEKGKSLLKQATKRLFSPLEQPLEEYHIVDESLARKFLAEGKDNKVFEDPMVINELIDRYCPFEEAE